MCAARARDELELFRQLCFSVATGELRSCEALVRWHVPIQGLVLSGEFLPLAEKSGLIVEIGDWVLAQACRIQFRWQRAGHAAVPIGANFSVRKLQRTNVAQSVEMPLGTHQLDPRWITLEINESKWMQASCFVGEVDAVSSDTFVITSAVISLGRNLDLAGIAEGVETQSQLDWLTREDCGGYQHFPRSSSIAHKPSSIA